VAGWLLLIVAVLLVPVSVLGVWSRNQLLDTDRYVETVTPLASDPAIQDAVVDRVTTALYSGVDVQSKVAAALPAEGAFLAAPISLGIENLIERVVRELVTSDQFDSLWIDANRVAHETLVTVLTEPGDRKGSVSVDLSGVAATVQSKLSGLGVNVFSGERSAPQLELFQSEELAKAQTAVSLFDTLATVLPWVTIALLVAAAVVFTNRRRGVMAAFGGLLVGSLLFIVVVALARWYLLQAIPAGSSISATEAVFDLLTRFVRGAVRALAAVGAVGVLAALLAGPSRPAVGLRRLVGAGVSRTGDAAAGHGARLGAFGGFLRSYVVAIRVAVVAIAVLFLLVVEQPSAGAVLWTAAIAVVALVVLEVLYRTAVAEQDLAGDAVGDAGAGAADRASDDSVESSPPA
jgi:hypothetical protein